MLQWVLLAQYSGQLNGTPALGINGPFKIPAKIVGTAVGCEVG